MHDPLTQAFVIPWRYRWSSLGNKPWRYWEPLITIWHKDPERRGSDDSCGWFRPKLNETQREICKNLAYDEARNPWFASLSAKTNPNPVECEALVRGAFLLISNCMRNRKCLSQPVTLEEATMWAAVMVHNPTDNFRSSLCFLSGYHSNWYRGDEGIANSPKEDEWWREEQARGFFGAIMGYILRERRPWYRHPKWHVWHWRLQIHPLQSFKRWAFSRCCYCGKGFAWGYSPTTNQWHGTGPLWFRSEKGVFHSNCDRPTDPCGPVQAVEKANE